MLGNDSDFQDRILRMQKAGISFAIDDFGVGHSSLGRIRLIGANTIKLDKSLLFEVVEDRKAYKMLGKLVDICHLIGANVVAEGIENRDQFLAAKDAGCDAFQGFYFMTPALQQNAIDWAVKNFNETGVLDTR